MPIIQQSSLKSTGGHGKRKKLRTIISDDDSGSEYVDSDCEGEGDSMNVDDLDEDEHSSDSNKVSRTLFKYFLRSFYTGRVVLFVPRWRTLGSV
jgi:hypothetical protein